MSAPSILVRSLWTQTYQPLSAFFFFFRLDPNFSLAHRMSGWKGSRKACHAQGEKAAKLTVLFLNPLHVAISNSHMGKNQVGGALHVHSTSGSQPQRKEPNRGRKRPCFFPRRYSNAGRSSVDLEQDRDKVGRLNSPKEVEIYLNHIRRLCSRGVTLGSLLGYHRFTKKVLVSRVKWVQL